MTIFIAATFDVLPEHAADWPGITASFTQATRSEPGYLWFEWSRSLERRSEYVLLEAFRDVDAATEHVQSAHFRTAQQVMTQYLAATPRIVNTMLDQDDWSELSELRVER
ncbi:MAG: antibiotic biosynthesis monooxygenase [Actinomycetota bacterium]|nr:antibiotic biosynthesis monooxygenase [Actinomycetota bacterium]